MNNEKKGSVLWVILLAVLVCVLVVIIGIAVHKNSGNTDTQPEQGSHEQQKPNGDSQTSQNGTEGETNAGSEKGSEKESESESDVPLPVPDKSEGKELFVIFGVDSRSNKLGKGTRSDSIMLVSMNHDAKEIKVVSIYRDCMLYQEGKGYKKVSNAHSYGGPSFALSVLNENFDLNLKNYVTVNFGGVQKLVDKIGGVEIELSQKEVNTINASCSEQLDGPGVHRLNGEQALAFSRIRKIDNDYVRTERQREVLFEIFKTSKNMSEKERVNLALEMIGDINTSYKSEDIVSLLYYMSEYEITTMTAYPRIFYGGIVDSSWVEVPCTLIDMNTKLHEILLGETDYTPSERVKEISKTLRDKVSGPNTNQKD